MAQIRRKAIVLEIASPSGYEKRKVQRHTSAMGEEPGGHSDGSVRADHLCDLLRSASSFSFA